jgi:hypothetical protein
MTCTPKLTASIFPYQLNYVVTCLEGVSREVFALIEGQTNLPLSGTGLPEPSIAPTSGLEDIFKSHTGLKEKRKIVTKVRPW